jgi:hypothetical protein
LRTGRVPQHRGVLVSKARHGHDLGKHLHTEVRLLQRGTSPRRCEGSVSRTWSSRQ